MKASRWFDSYMLELCWAQNKRKALPGNEAEFSNEKV
jgi:hypothetical protein